MKKYIAVLLCCLLIFTGCTTKNSAEVSQTEGTEETQTVEIDFPELNDSELLQYMEDNVYNCLIDELDSDEYFIENVQAVYVSKEYLEEVAYNSQENIFFGYTLSALNAQFEGVKYVFTLGEDGKTVVREFEAYDDTYEKAIKNVAAGGGVILLCVTVSVATGGTASVIFLAAAKTGTAVALSDGMISGLIAGTITGIQTKDFEQAKKAAILESSEGFKWGAFGGTITSGVSAANKISKLRGVKLNGLKLEEAAKIQLESKYPIDIIKSFHSMDEYKVFKAAKLKATRVNGKWALTRKIDWKQMDEYGRTNAERVKDGLAPIDANGKSYELHHIGQNDDSPLAILTHNEHKNKKNYKILHENTGEELSEINREAFSKQRHEFWKSLLEQTGGV